MMSRLICTITIVALIAASAIAAPPGKKEVKTLKQWAGSADDAESLKDDPAVVTDAKALEKLWKSWKLPGKVPEVDFAKDLVVTSTTVGSRLLNVTAMLDDKGDLQAFGMATADIAPGFRYVVLVVSREGVKSVNGKKL
jgi:hypothetical protein